MNIREHLTPTTTGSLAGPSARMEQLGADDPVGWARSEIRENTARQADTTPTSGPSDDLIGRDVGGLHEDILSLDPSGREGSDLF
ncbi:MAG: hypothetical protein J2P32_01610 [Actinobacteria bacterium]|nr:hypothetical protein [Actinomycetota bacterium]